MSHNPITHLFNSYDLQEDPYKADKINCQEVVDYCEARFRLALQGMINAIDEDLVWMTKTLFRELELCFSYIGVAAAIGRSIEIPILVRSLGHDLYRFGLKPNVKFEAGIELLIYIDGNLSSHGIDDPNLLVETFHLPWWSGHNRPTKQSEYLSFSTLSAALAEHQEHLKHQDGAESPKRSVDLCAELNKPTYTWHPEVDADLDNPCTRCRLYRAVSFGLADKLRDAENRAHGLEVANVGERDIGMRRASACNELYENVLNKEVELEQRAGAGVGSGSGPGNTFKERLLGKKGKDKGKEKVSRIAERVRAEAEDSLRASRHSNNVCGGVDSKWTWGVELNSQDLWNIVRGADRQLQLPHSGYDDELRTGKLRSSSPIPLPTEIDDDDPDIMFDQLAHDFPFIRDLRTDEIPVAFAFPTLHYMAAGESVTEAESPPLSGSEYYGEGEGDEQTNRKQKKLAMQREVNSPDQPSTSDSVSIISKRSPPHRPWLGPPPHGYVQPPTLRPSLVYAPTMVGGFKMRVELLPDEAGPPANYPAEPEWNTLQSDLDPIDVSMHGYQSDNKVDDVSSDASDRPVGTLGWNTVQSGMGAEQISFGHSGLVEPDSSDNGDEELSVGNLGWNYEDSAMVSDDTADDYGLVPPESPDDSDEDMHVGNLGFDEPDSDGSDIVVGNLGLDFMDSGERSDSDVDEPDPPDRVRVRIPLPLVNPATGQYTADSFQDVPDAWLD